MTLPDRVKSRGVSYPVITDNDRKLLQGLVDSARWAEREAKDAKAELWGEVRYLHSAKGYSFASIAEVIGYTRQRVEQICRQKP